MARLNNQSHSNRLHLLRGECHNNQRSTSLLRIQPKFGVYLSLRNSIRTTLVLRNNSKHLKGREKHKPHLVGHQILVHGVYQSQLRTLRRRPMTLRQLKDKRGINLLP